MKQLPDEFQFRSHLDKGFTHTASFDGKKVKVKWARGWHEKRFDETPYAEGDKLWTVVDKFYAENWLEDGTWVIVEDKPKQEETSLPNEFYFRVYDDVDVYHMCKEHDGYRCTDKHGNSAWHSHKFAEAAVKEGSWKIVDKKPLTAEQQRTLKELNEQVQQLTNSIKLQEQDIEHKRRLISNYVQRQQELMTKIKELEGV